jgi:hypothetical protein
VAMTGHEYSRRPGRGGVRSWGHALCAQMRSVLPSTADVRDDIMRSHCYSYSTQGLDGGPLSLCAEASSFRVVHLQSPHAA